MKRYIGLLALAVSTQACGGCTIHANTGDPRVSPAQRAASGSGSTAERPSEGAARSESAAQSEDTWPSEDTGDDRKVDEILVVAGMAPVVRKRLEVVASVKPETLMYNYMCGDEGEERYVSKTPDLRLAVPDVMPRLQVGVPQKVWGLLVSSGERFWCKKAKTEHGALLNLADLPAATYDVRIVLSTQGTGEYRLELRDPSAPR